MSVAAISATARGGGTTPASAVRHAFGPPRLAPPLGLEGLMHLAQTERREIQQSAAESEMRSIQGKRETQTKDARSALERAEREGKEANDAAKGAAFWKKCACWAGAVAAVAATCCTMGSATPLAVVAVGVALSASSPYIGKAVGEATGSESAGQWTTVGCMVAGAALQIAGGAMSPAAAAGSVQAFAQGTQLVATGAAGAATAAEGVRTYESKKHEANAEDARANGMAARAHAKRSQSEFDAVIDELRALEGSIRRALDAVGAAGREVNAGRERVAMQLARSY